MGNGGSRGRAGSTSSRRAALRTDLAANGGGFELARQGTPGTAAGKRATGTKASGKLTPAQALDQAHAALRAAANGSDAERLAAAKALVAADKAASRSSGPGGKAKGDSLVKGLTMRNHVDGRMLGPDRTVNAYMLMHMYGPSQFRQAVTGYPLGTLKEAAAEVMRRNPGTKPSSMGSKSAIVDYLGSHVHDGDPYYEYVKGSSTPLSGPHAG